MTNRIGVATLQCPYCRDRIEAYELRVRCTNCRTAFHSSCWSENGKCSVFGCFGKPEAGYRRLLLFFPAAVLILSTLSPMAGVILSFLVLPAYAASAVVTVHFTSDVLAALRRNRADGSLLSSLLAISVNIVAIAIFLRMHL